MSGGPQAGPVETATAVLLDWLSRCDVPARLARPGDGDPSSLNVWPTALLTEQEVREPAGPATLRLRVRYLLAVDPAAGPDAGRLLDRVLTGSLTGDTVQLPAEPVTAGLWQSFGTPPLLGLYADIPARAHRPALSRPPRTGSPLQVTGSPLAMLRGRVVGPNGTPVPHLRVVAAGTGAVTHTDGKGRFAFTALPAGERVRLLLSGKGFQYVAEVEVTGASAGSAEPVTIHCDMEEE